MDSAADERGAHRKFDKNGDDLGDEGERRLLHLRQCLEQCDDQTDEHGGRHRGTRPHDDCPDRRAKQLQRVGFIHDAATITPGLRVTVLPSFNVAMAPPPAESSTETTIPLVFPSAEVTDLPIMVLACADSSASSVEFVWTCCSTVENDASW